MNPPVRIGFFRKEGGRIPLMLWMRSLSTTERALAQGLVNQLELHGNELSFPYTRALSGFPNLFELRTREGKVHLRVFFCYLPSGVSVMLDGLRKTDAGDQRRAISKVAEYAKLVTTQPAGRVVFEFPPQEV
jgi:hypothetical protein